MKKESIKMLIASINREIEKLINKKGEYYEKTLLELMKLKMYHEKRLTDEA